MLFRSAPLADFFGYFLVRRQESNISRSYNNLYLFIRSLWALPRQCVFNDIDLQKSSNFSFPSCIIPRTVVECPQYLDLEAFLMKAIANAAYFGYYYYFFGDKK